MVIIILFNTSKTITARNRIFLFSIILFSGILFSNNVYGAITDGVVFHLSFDDINGSIYDSAGSGLIIKNNMMNLTIPGKLGSARQSTANTHFINVTNINYSLSPNLSFSLNMWVNNMSIIAGEYSGLFFLSSAQTAGSYFAFTYNNPVANKMNFFGTSTGYTSANITEPSWTGGSWIMVTLVLNYTGGSNYDYIIYLNGTETARKTGTNSSILRSDLDHFLLGSGNSATRGAKGTYDEVTFFNRTISETEILTLFNSGSGISYPFVYTPPVSNYNITLNQSPPDLNTSVLLINVSAVVTSNNTNLTSSGTANIYYRPVTSLNNGCSIFYQRVCHSNSSDYEIRNMTILSNSTFKYNFDDTQIYPGYYPFDYEYINNNIGANYTAYQNNNIRFNIFNFSTSNDYTFLSLEMDAVNESSLTASMLIYYCNSSYSTGSPALNENCELISTYLPQTWNHVHNFSRHGGIQFQVRDITKTQNSSIVFISPNILPANGWRFRYVTNSSYDNTSFYTGNAVNWAKSNLIFDVHIHNYKPSDYFNYYVMYNDGNGTLKNSSAVTDYYNITQYPPTIPQLITPCGYNYTFNPQDLTPFNITFNWTDSSDSNNDSINYDLEIYSPAYDDIVCNSLNDSECNVLSSAFGLDGYTTQGIYNYTTRVYAYDGTSQVISEYSACSFSLCVSNWVKTIQPCNNNLKQIIYADGNKCSIAYNVPSDNSSYETCESTITNNTYFDFSDNFYVHLFFIFTILVLFNIAVFSTGFFKFIFSLSGVVLYGYGQYLTNTLFIDHTADMIYYAQWWINGAIYITTAVLIFSGIYYLWIAIKQY